MKHPTYAAYICLTSVFSNFTKGKIYKEYVCRRKHLLHRPESSNILYLINDLGEVCTSSISGYCGPSNFEVYFMEVSRWREKQIDKILTF